MSWRSTRWRPASCPRWTRGPSSSTTTCRWGPRWPRPTRCSAGWKKVLLETPDVQGYIRRTGAELGFFATESYTGDILVSLKPSGQRRPMAEIFDALRDQLEEEVPELETEFVPLVQDQINDLAGVRARSRSRSSAPSWPSSASWPSRSARSSRRSRGPSTSTRTSCWATPTSWFAPTAFRPRAWA